MSSVSHSLMRKKKTPMKRGENQKKNKLIPFSTEGHYLSGIETPVWWAIYKKIGKILHLNMYMYLAFVEKCQHKSWYKHKNT